MELLVVIAVIGLLAALLFPALHRSKGQAERTLCASNLHQWGTAFATYAGDYHNSFPNNLDGTAGPSWCGTNVQTFWTNYLVPLVRSREINKTHVLFCPTEKWHRAADLAPQVGQNGQLAVGFFVLPYRDLANSSNDQHTFDYDAGGLRGWVEKQRFGGEFAPAPVVMDQMQALRSTASNAPPPGLDWFGMLGMGDAPAGAPAFFEPHQSVGRTRRWKFPF